VAQIRRAYVDVDGSQIHYRWLEGAAETPIVFLHQTASSSEMYEKVMRRLAGDRPQYAFDTPGFGQSDPPPPAPTVASYARTILAAARGIGVDRFHVFGHHTGASIGFELAVSAPDRIASLTMAGPPYMDAEAREFWTNKIEAMVIQADGRHVMGAWERAQALDPDPDLAVVHRETVDTLRAGPRWHEAYLAVFSYDMPARFSQVQCPVLMLSGKHDVLLPYQEAACAAHPDTTCVTLEGGTYVIDDHPELVAAEIRTFLSTVR
jgi:pimeloyl-ACP methyl ester carboxylesterase